MSKIHKIKCGNTERWSFSKIKPILDMPYLIEVQKDSYKYLVEKGLKEVFDDFSPITDYSGKLELEFIDYTLDGDCKYSVKQCKERDKTYTSPLRVTVRLTIKETGKAIENTVFMGDFPKMTDRGIFIINGAERVVVSQLVRSPGVYTAEEKDRNGVARYNTTVIPNRGAWLEFEQDNNNVLSVRVDKTRKITATMLLRALGFGTNERLAEIFGQDEMLEATMAKDAAVQTVDEAKIEVYRKLKPGEIPTANGVDVLLTNLLFDSRRYDISRVGRYNFNKKLSVAERTEGRTLARDIEFDGEIIAEKGEVLTSEKAKEIQNLGINEVYIVTPDGGEYKVIGNNTVDLAFYIHSNPRDLGIMEKVYFPVLKPILDEYGDDVESLKIACKENADILVTKHISIDDIIAAVSYNFGMKYGFCQPDNIDHLSNRRVRMVGELLQNQFRIGIARLERVVRERMSSFQNMDDVTPAKLINIRPVSSAIREFFGSSQLSQFMDQPNPIAELTHKRKLSALGPGGLNRERAGFEVRDVHHSHYGRMCPIETPEGQNIGLITSLSSYAKVNEYGFIEAPYRRVDRATGFVTDVVDYLTADEEDKHIVAQANEPLTEDNHFVHERVICRHRDLIKEYPANQVDYMDVDPKQLVSVATSLIPFLENDDANRALMGSNMQRQAVPLLRPEAPIIGTGMEYKVAYDSGVCIVAKNAGVVTKVLADEITVTCDDGQRDVYTLQKFERSNQGTCVNQKVIVSHGQRVEKGDVLADGPSVDNGELALGRNILIGFMTWEGYNYEDAILISEDLVKKDVFTSIHIEEHQIESRDIKFGEEQITRDIPNVSEDLLKNLDEDGIVRIGAEVNSGDYLVGKVTPKGETELTPEERLLKAIFGEKSREVRDVSLKVPHGDGGIVVDVKVMSRENKDELEPGVNKLVRVYIAQKRKIGVGDKMAGRHGNKGVISRVLPREDMPFLPDGTPLQIVLNPLGVPSRMNIGQVLEVHLGLVAKLLGYKIATPVFDGAKEDDISELFKQNNLPLNGKMEVYDGRTGEKFENPVTVGYMYMLKLNHLVDDKIHARSVGPYSLVTQQPLGGKAQRGGQRFGEMEVWALEAYGAANILQEMLTVKSDDVLGRQSVFDSIIKNTVAATPGIPESFKVLQKEMQSLCLDVNLLSDNQESIKITETYDDDKDEYAGVVARDDHKALETDMFDLFGSHDTILDDDDDSPLFGKSDKEKGIDSLGDLDSIIDDDLLGYGNDNPLDDDKDTDLFDMEVGDSEAALLEEFDNNDDDNI